MEEYLRGRYRIDEKIGKGGSGQVYKVWDTYLEKYWAIKEFYRKQKEEPSKEVQVLAQLNHPGFPRIVDIFMEENIFYLVMDFVEGVTLEVYMRESMQSEKDILSIGIQAAEALLYLHERIPPLLYLDLKPDNILVDEQGKIKIIDLGSVRLKGTGSDVSGTPGFSSPEQRLLTREGKELGEQSDVYSLGMVLFCMFQKNCHCLPIVEKNNRRGIMIRKYNPAVSVYTERIVEKATRGNWKKRYGNMREMKTDMETALKKIMKKKGQIIIDCIRGEDKTGFWQQERNILFYAGKNLKSNVFLLLLLMIFGGIFQVFFIKSHAGNEKEAYIAEIGNVDKKFKIFIRDSAFRKILVKKGEAYYTKENLILEIPWENFENKEYRVELSCYENGVHIEKFGLDCIFESKKY